METNNKPLVSALIVAYNSGDLIFETIDSVLMQDYPNIELIISDDASKKGFDKQEIEEYIKKNRQRNIKNYKVFKNTENLGTVKHLENMREVAKGEFDISIAGDDVWIDNTVFSDFINRFIELGDAAEFIVSQVQMCDEKLEKIISNFIPDDEIEIIKKGNQSQLLNISIYHCILPGLGSAFRSTFHNKIGKLSDQYKLIEDWTTHIRALKRGIPVFYLDRVTAKHRDGGVSHGNSRNCSDTYFDYCRDLLVLFENEIMPNSHDFDENAFEKALSNHEFRKEKYIEEFNAYKRYSSKKEKKILGISKWKIQEYLKNKLTKFCNLNEIKKNLICNAILFIAVNSISFKNNTLMPNFINYFIFICSMFMFFLLNLQILCKFIILLNKIKKLK
ncbi:glycosyltransferase [Aminipila butyrica]|uniref:Glycosyltransferase n=1 Tax=Aminipila butyrica TaxID=433296 RepID=A0A858BS62_9FIRM|nr:glycosyltransferase [Aminipila butyrica]QIB68172.1 glycosyltransferase [Aminipila butyrica]